jgi:uncharacterized protein (TIGR00251 family)
MFFQLKDQKLLIDLYVQPGAKVSQICGLHGERLKLKISSPPVDGKANSEVIEFFSKILGLTKHDVKIVSGDKSRNKRVAVAVVSEEIISILRKLVNE